MMMHPRPPTPHCVCQLAPWWQRCRHPHHPKHLHPPAAPARRIWRPGASWPGRAAVRWRGPLAGPGGAARRRRRRRRPPQGGAAAEHLQLRGGAQGLAGGLPAEERPAGPGHPQGPGRRPAPRSPPGPGPGGGLGGPRRPPEDRRRPTGPPGPCGPGRRRRRPGPGRRSFLKHPLGYCIVLQLQLKAAEQYILWGYAWRAKHKAQLFERNQTGREREGVHVYIYFSLAAYSMKDTICSSDDK
mmetsp:Transcript_35288/g.58068  ORF Transcript_35288/g.58068 Transcript_35288/m.58068 type:complete len:242 (-) Transcript_35288:223-948(-)